MPASRPALLAREGDERPARRVMREHERAQFSGMFYYVFGVLLVTALFPPAFAVLGIMQVPPA